MKKIRLTIVSAVAAIALLIGGVGLSTSLWQQPETTDSVAWSSRWVSNPLTCNFYVNGHVYNWNNGGPTFANGGLRYNGAGQLQYLCVYGNP
jgi:hypothetical protein